MADLHDSNSVSMGKTTPDTHMVGIISIESVSLTPLMASTLGTGRSRA